MRSKKYGKTSLWAAILGVSALILSACSGGNPLNSASHDTASDGLGSKAHPIVVTSQDYYSNEIIAQVYAHVLEQEGFFVDRQMRIGQREVYLTQLREGSIHVIPEYTGNLLQFLAPASENFLGLNSEETTDKLRKYLPDTLNALNPAAASDQDSYQVTKAVAAQYGLKSLADLTKLPAPVIIGGNSELSQRAYGPKGLQTLYQVEAKVHGIEDSGGPLTLRALLDSTVQVADIYSSDPAIKANDLVTLSDPKGLILPQNIIPIVAKSLPKKAREALETVSSHLDTDTLATLNAKSISEQKPAELIAKEWVDSWS